MELDKYPENASKHQLVSQMIKLAFINSLRLVNRIICYSRGIFYFGLLPRVYIEKGFICEDQTSVSLGHATLILRDTWLNVNRGAGVTLTIGSNVVIGRRNQISAWGDVVIEDSVLLSSNVYITDVAHNYLDPTRPIRNQGASFIGPVRLREGCWIGINSVILPGVTIGRNTVVGANSVVTSDLPDNVVAAGSPARVIRKIND